MARIAVAAGLVAALSAAGPIPMAFSADHAPATPDPGTKSASAKLGSDDADLLAEAEADGATRQREDREGHAVTPTAVRGRASGSGRPPFFTGTFHRHVSWARFTGK
ncbi:hypothetical protein OG762_14740 [Streptomyces sp. NBC_01136]|uniref:hypothetical protein n=1 Tax=Streptomyces sp. NBC_01136 TaxID=2903754 RepID=UPI00386E4EE5|nr:hypothetical protein OG762_14740 [Streptomyces sp. NBC_01136]